MNGLIRKRASSKSAHISTVNFDELLSPPPTQQSSSWIPHLRQSRTLPSKQISQNGGNSSQSKLCKRESRLEMPPSVPRSQRRLKSSSAFLQRGSVHANNSSNSEIRQAIVPGAPKVGKGAQEETPLERKSPAKSIPMGMIMTGTATTTFTTGSYNSGANSKHTEKPRERVQVCRTKEEKEKNPDCIRMEKSGLRVFPDIGGGESTTVKLLSLQHNVITKLENVPLLTQLVVLDLYDNRIERITGLQAFPSLRVLLLGKNRIKRIEGLDGLKRLEILDMHGNQLRYVDNLGGLSSLRVLNLAGNLLRSIRSLGPFGLCSLVELNLKRNRIKNLEGLQRTPHLKKLLLANNEIHSFANLAPLRKLVLLDDLVLDPNPLVSSAGSEYKSQVLTILTHLQTLDRNPVTEEMRSNARLWHKNKLAEELARQEEEERLRKELDLSIGPPGSREQVIFQARRRWESLRKFVTTTGSKIEEPKRKSTLVGVVKKAIEQPFPVLELYPPDTLDLEVFPSGEVMDKMESLVGVNTKKQDNNDEQDVNELQKIFVQSENNVPPSEPDAVNVIQELVHVELSKSPLRQKKTDKNDMTNLGDIAREVERTVVNESLKDVESCEHSEKLAEDKISQIKPNSVTTEIQGVTDDTGVRRVSIPDASPSSRVAIVRPLVRDENNDLISIEQMLVRCENVVSGDLFETINDLRSENNTEESHNHKDLEPVLEDLHRQLLEPSEPGSTVDCAIGSFESSGENAIKLLGDVHQNGNIDSDTGVSGSRTPEKHPGLTGTIEQRESVTRPKRLQHLRSISLDSGAGMSTSTSHFLEPAGHFDDGSSLMSDNNNGDSDSDLQLKLGLALSKRNASVSPLSSRQSSNVATTTNRLVKEESLHKTTFPRTRSQRIKFRDRAAKLARQNSTGLSPRPTTTTNRRGQGLGSMLGGDGISNGGAQTSLMGKPSMSGRVLRRCESATSLTTPSSTCSSSTGGSSSTSDLEKVTQHRKQGHDFLVEVDGKVLNVFGHGGLKHALVSFPNQVTCHVSTAKFSYISYDHIVPYFSKLRSAYPSLEHVSFRANNLTVLAQLDALSDLQGVTSLYVSKEGNPLVENKAWIHYASYRLSHWGLQNVNGAEVCSEYRGGGSPALETRGFESLGFLALSCLPQSALSPLARRLHMLHCFCCCSPSSSSDESNRIQRSGNQKTRVVSPSQENSSRSFCTSWDDDPVLLDVIGKEALVYCPVQLPPEPNAPEGCGFSNDVNATLAAQWEREHQSMTSSTPKEKSSLQRQQAETFGRLIQSGTDILGKVDQLERVWPTLMTDIIQEILMDFRFMDSYMKKELKKAHDAILIQNNNFNGKRVPH